MKKLLTYFLVVGSVSALLSFGYYMRLFEMEKTKKSYINKTFDYILHTDEQNDALFVGSSRVWVHVDPERIAHATGLSTYNLACDGSSLAEHSAMIKTYLQHHPAPKYIFINLDFLCFDVFHETYNFPEYIPHLTDSTIAATLLRFNPKLRNPLKKNVYLFKWLSAQEDPDKISALLNPAYFDTDFSPGYKGFVPAQKKWDKEADEKLKVKKKAVFPKEGQALFAELVKICHSHNIRLIGIVAPVYKRYTEVVTNAGWMMKQIEKTCEKEGVELWDLSKILYTQKQYYYNSTHLNATGAAIYTDSLATRINKLVKR